MNKVCQQRHVFGANEMSNDALREQYEKGFHEGAELERRGRLERYVLALASSGREPREPDWDSTTSRPLGFAARLVADAKALMVAVDAEAK